MNSLNLSPLSALSNQPLSTQSNQNETLGQIATNVWKKNGTLTIVLVGGVLGLGAYALDKLLKW